MALMGFLDYRDAAKGAPLPAAVTCSELETRASGFTVGRLDVWPAGVISGTRARELVLESGLDVVVIRSSADDVRLAADMQCPELVILQADTLLYFEVEARRASKPMDVGLRPLGPDDAPEVDRLVGQTFANYRNHWSATPVFDAVDVQGAYQDWAHRSLMQPGLAVMRVQAADGQDVGVCVVDERPPDLCDILLAGVLPTYRRRGHYQHMMRAVIDRAASQGRASVAISTQAANVGVMRAWCRVGFVPVIVLNTLHAVRRDRFPAAEGMVHTPGSPGC